MIFILAQRKSCKTKSDITAIFTQNPCFHIELLGLLSVNSTHKACYKNIQLIPKWLFAANDACFTAPKSKPLIFGQVVVSHRLADSSRGECMNVCTDEISPLCSTIHHPPASAAKEDAKSYLFYMADITQTI